MTRNRNRNNDPFYIQAVSEEGIEKAVLNAFVKFTKLIQSAESYPPYMRKSTACKMLDISTSTFDYYRKKKLIEPVFLEEGKGMRFKKEDVLELLKKSLERKIKRATTTT